MPIDASIYGAFAPRVKSVAELDNEWTRGQLNQLALMGAQEEAKDRVRKRQEDEALRGVVSGFGADTNANYQALLRAGHLKPAQDYLKSTTELSKTKAEEERARADAEKDRVAAIAQRTQRIFDIASGVRDPQSYAQARSLLAMQGFDMSGVPEQYDPAFVESAKQWALTEAQRAENIWKELNLRTTIRGQDLTAETTRRGQDMTASTTRRGQDITVRGQNMTDARARETNAVAREANVTAKELANEQKALQVQKLEAEIDEKKQRKASDIANMERSAQLIDLALNHPGRSVGTGLSSVADPRNFIPGTDAKNFGVLADQLQGRAFLQAFETLKGGGQITEVEGRKATEAIARLNRAQSDDEFVASLKDLRSVVSAGYKRATGKELPSGEGGATGKFDMPDDIKSLLGKYGKK